MRTATAAWDFTLRLHQRASCKQARVRILCGSASCRTALNQLYNHAGPSAARCLNRATHPELSQAETLWCAHHRSAAQALGRALHRRRHGAAKRELQRAAVWRGHADGCRAAAGGARDGRGWGAAGSTAGTAAGAAGAAGSSTAGCGAGCAAASGASAPGSRPGA